MTYESHMSSLLNRFGDSIFVSAAEKKQKINSIKIGGYASKEVRALGLGHRLVSSTTRRFTWFYSEKYIELKAVP